MAETSETETPNEGDREPEQEQKPKEEELEATDGARVVDFGTAAETLTNVLDIDGRHGETITDLHTTTTDDGRQLVATIEKSRSTMLNHRLNGAKRTGRRVVGRAVVLVILVGIAYLGLTARHLLGDGGSESDTEQEGHQQDDT